ncbi:MAG TPA: TIR domain-containing protein [Anaerolineales bacterium]|nr:TIR domain-containing protein [Anaerolineales bacterium]
MGEESKRPLKVFLCHASGDKPAVRDLYKRLITEGIDAWLDQEKLMPGQDWRSEIPRAVREADVVVVCLSNKSITKEGYIQKEIRFALDIAKEKPEGTIFLIPTRLEDCVVPERLSRWQWVDLFDDNGFLKLLRSLKLRADKVGAAIEPPSYESEDSEVGKRLEQLYTDGLAAFYTEDWDRAYQRFQTILRERPSHQNAAEKLAQAERHRNLAKLYVQATEAYSLENWQTAIKVLDELLQKSPDYKDAPQLLKNARKQKQLKELYAEAKTLHNAEKWQAVLKVFEQISTVEPTYPDPEGLLSSAQREAAELKRLADLNDLYSQGVHRMDAGQWYEARDLLEQVHKGQTGFLDTERLLRKVENEIIRIEELEKRNNQINTLYEQAHGLIRSKSWRMALDKMEAIQRLDDQFIDEDQIAQKAKSELELEEQEAERQNRLAALYAEAVRLLKDSKYQEALDQWQEVKTIDPRYPDRQRVQSTALRKSTELGKPLRNKPRFTTVAKPIWAGLIGLIAIGVVVASIVLLDRNNLGTSASSTVASSTNTVSIPTGTIATIRTDTTQPASLVPTAIALTDPTIYDDFNNPAHNGQFNTTLWGGDISAGKIVQGNGLLTFELQGDQRDIGLNASKTYKPDYPIFVESKMRLDPTSRKDAVIYITLTTSNGGSACAIVIKNIKGEQVVSCWSSYFGAAQRFYERGITPGTWHVLRIEMYPDTMTFVYLVDDEKIGSYIPRNPDKLKDLSYYPAVHVNSGTDSNPGVTGYADYVSTGITSFVWDFDKSIQGWGDDFRYDISIPKALNGSLTFKTTGDDPYIHSPTQLHISAATPAVTIRMRITNGKGSFGAMFFLTDKDKIWDGAKYASFQIKNDGAFHTYDVLMPPAWQGVITQLRLDPIEDAAANTQIEIDYISVHPR